MYIWELETKTGYILCRVEHFSSALKSTPSAHKNHKIIFHLSFTMGRTK